MLPKRSAVIFVLTIGFMLTSTACGASNDDLPLTIDAQIGDTLLADADATDPVALEPNEIVDLSATVTNTSGADVVIRHIRLEGEVMDLTFVSYDTTVSRSVPANSTVEVAIPLDLFDLDGQAHGYLRGTIALLDDDRERLGAQEFAMDVRGRALSSMGVVAFLLLFATAVSLLVLLWAISQRRLSPNRFARALRFAATGLGVGLLLTVGFSILRIFPLPTSGWLPMVLIPTAIGFAVGYVNPIGVFDPDEDDEAEVEADLADAMA